VDTVNGLEPKPLWQSFAELSAIPRNSKNETLSRNFVIAKAIKHGLDYKTDSAGNVVVYKPARGSTSDRTVILQAHLDMVCEKNRDTVHDFEKDPIRLVNDGEWVQACGTTLGADNGIACAAMLAIMEESTLTHPGLELFFTMDEETGLTGAVQMDAALINGRTLINLDSEEDGIFYIGCAGGKETDLKFGIKRVKTPGGFQAVTIRVKGLKGGHSGTDIHEGRGNAIKIIAGLLASSGTNFRLSAISGGNLRNSIPREAEALIVAHPAKLKKLKAHAENFLEKVRTLLKGIDEGLAITVEDAPLPEDVISGKQASAIIETLNAIPSGVEAVDMPHSLIVTSTSLGVVRTEASHITVKTMQRSIHEEAMEELSGRIASIGRLAGADVTFDHEYPSWIPDYNSSILRVCKEAHLELFGKEPEVRVIHAGLECGVIAGKIPGIETISLGPTIEHAHSPFERVRVESVGNFWKLLLYILDKLAV
jgi:dipeptidase D